MSKTPAIHLALMFALTGCTSTDNGVVSAPANGGPGDSGGAAASFVPGVCAGKRTACDPPTFDPIAPPLTTTVECPEEAPLSVAWTQPLGKYDCTLPDCPAVDPRVAVGKSGYFALAEIREPSPATLLGEGVFGYALASFDSTGTARDTVASDLRQRVDGPYPEFTTRVLKTNANGELLWVAPTADGDGLELRRYSADGQRASTQRATSGTSTADGDAVWLDDDSVVLAYRYEEPSPEAGRPSRVLPGVAKFDKTGRLVWNQTLFAALAADPTVSRVSISLAGADAGGRVVVRTSEVPIDLAAFDSSELVKLDPDGNVVWAKRLTGIIPPTSSTTLSASAGVSADGSVSMISSNSLSGDQRTYFDAIDSDGNPGVRVELALVFSESDAVFDNQGRAIVVTDASSHLNAYTIERDTPRCTMQQVPAPACLKVDAQGAGSCDDPSVVLTSADGLFFGVANSVGVAVRP